VGVVEASGAQLCAAGRLPAPKCLHVRLPASKCLHVRLPAPKCLHVRLPAPKCLHVKNINFVGSMFPVCVGSKVPIHHMCRIKLSKSLPSFSLWLLSLTDFLQLSFLSVLKTLTQLSVMNNPCVALTDSRM